MLVRAWLHDGQVVARLRWSVSGDHDQQVEIVVGEAEVKDRVQLWLREVAQRPR